MENVVYIQHVQNGFIVRPEVPNSHVEARTEHICVFETHEAMFEYLKAQFPIKIKAEIQGD